MMKFLIIKPSSLGDVLHAFPAVHALCRAFPGSRADWLINPAFQDLLDYLPSVDRRIVFQRKKMGTVNGFFQEFPALYRNLHLERYDAVIDLQGLLRSAFFSACCKSPIHAGPLCCKEKLSRLFYNRKMTWPEQTFHALEKNNQMIQSLYPDQHFDFNFQLPEHPAALASFHQLLEKQKDTIRKIKGKKWIGIAPGARWDSKQWEPEFFARMIRYMAQKQPDSVFFIFGSADEAASAGIILENTGNIPVINLTGMTGMLQLVEGIRAMDLLIANDSGPMHIAASAGTPVAAFFGPTRPDLTGPYTERKRIFQPQLTCICCFKRYCESKECHRAIDPDAAAEQSLTLMEEISRP